MGTTHATDNYNGALDAFIMCKTLHSQRHADGYDNKRSLPEDHRECRDSGRECKVGEGTQLSKIVVVEK